MSTLKRGYIRPWLPPSLVNIRLWRSGNTSALLWWTFYNLTFTFAFKSKPVWHILFNVALNVHLNFCWDNKTQLRYGPFFREIKLSKQQNAVLKWSIGRHPVWYWPWTRLLLKDWVISYLNPWKNENHFFFRFGVNNILNVTEIDLYPNKLRGSQQYPTACIVFADGHS